MFRLLELLQSIGSRRENALRVMAWEEVYDVIKQVCHAIDIDIDPDTSMNRRADESAICATW